MKLFIRALAGAAVVVIISLLSRTKNYYVAGLVPLFPTFALISHYVIGTERTVHELKETILFGMCSLLPYLAYLTALYWLVDRLKLELALVGAVACWVVAAIVLIVLWNRM
ncbi:MAG: GlpM family protein [Chloroflexi bacterium]|nr:GlpM family protein [Chloroflexota bacterium]